MPLRVSVDHQRRFVHVRADGEIRLEDAEAFLDTLAVENAMSYRKLIDSRDGYAKYVAADLVQLAARLKLYKHIDRRGAAAVVVNPKHMGMVEQLLELGRPQRPGRAFLNYADAERWLNEQPEA